MRKSLAFIKTSSYHSTKVLDHLMKPRLQLKQSLLKKKVYPYDLHTIYS